MHAALSQVLFISRAVPAPMLEKPLMVPASHNGIVTPLNDWEQLGSKQARCSDLDVFKQGQLWATCQECMAV